MKIQVTSLHYLSQIILLFFVTHTTVAQSAVPLYYGRDKSFDEALSRIVADVRLDSAFDVGEDIQEHISFVVIDLTGDKPVFGGAL